LGIREKEVCNAKTRAMWQYLSQVHFFNGYLWRIINGAQQWRKTTILCDVQATNVIPMFIGFTFIFGDGRAECSMNLSELINSKITWRFGSAEN